MPGVAQELSPNRRHRRARVVPPIEYFEIAGIAHTHAADRGAWMLLAAVAVALAAGLWRRATIGESLG